MLSYDFDSSGDGVCFHCIFWTNYSPECRQLVDGVYGKTIVEYVLECKDTHNKDTCSKGACFLCDALNGVPIEGIMDGEVLTVAKPKKVAPIDDFSFKIYI